MYELIIQPVLTGISTGMFCMTYCVPFVAPMLVSEDRDFKQTAKALLQFMAGRLLGYILFGALFGYLGEKLTNQTFNIISILALMTLSLLMILYAIGAIRQQKWFCTSRSVKNKLPFSIGILTGVNLCPPFLLSLNYIFTLHSTLRGILFFLLFFLGTNLYFIPLLFLSQLSRIEVFQKYARLAALIVGLSFFLYGGYYLVRGNFIWH